MKIIDKFRFLLSALAITTVASFAGVVSGTLAWFAYSTRATVAYEGTSVNQSELLQVGLVCKYDYWLDNRAAAEENYGLKYERINNMHIYFGKAGSGLNSNAIKAYLEKSGYADSRIAPVTSRVYNQGEDLTLYQSIQATKGVNDRVATTDLYSHIKFAIRVINHSRVGQTYQKNESVWLTDVTAQAEGPGNISNAVRLYFNGTQSNGGKFVLNPNATIDGVTKVAGLLNLNGDEYYDYDTQTNAEYLYGDYEVDPSLQPTTLADDSDLIDMNGSGNYNNTGTTFYAKHKGGIQSYNDYDAFNNGFTAKTADYLAFNSIRPEDDAGALSGGRVLCKTSNDDNALAFLDLTIWLEGWDFSVIDSEINHQFNLGLQFQINRD